MLIDHTQAPQEFEGQLYDQRHGGPFDRGAADSWYHSPPEPHYYVGATYMSERVNCEPGTQAHAEYMAGYEFNERSGGKKDWF